MASVALSPNEALRCVGRDALVAVLEAAAGEKKLNKLQSNLLQRLAGRAGGAGRTSRHGDHRVCLCRRRLARVQAGTLRFGGVGTRAAAGGAGRECRFSSSLVVRPRRPALPCCGGGGVPPLVVLYLCPATVEFASGELIFSARCAVHVWA